MHSLACAFLLYLAIPVFLLSFTAHVRPWTVLLSVVLLESGGSEPFKGLRV